MSDGATQGEVSASRPALEPSILDLTIDQVLSRAFLYDHPDVYREGVAATIAALRDVVESGREAR